MLNTTAATEARPDECGDDYCAGHIDETTGDCILCGQPLSTTCGTCDAYGPCARECPERDSEWRGGDL